MTQSLTQRSLAHLDKVDVPSYDRSRITAGIVHFGVGGFHRSHQAMYLDRLISAGEADDWGICAIGALEQDERIISTLAAQDGLYTLVLKHADGRWEPRVIGSIVETMFAPADPLAVVARLADPRTRIVTLTITEGGYFIDEETGQLDDQHPSILAELDRDIPETVFGFITAALAERRERGEAPFTVLSCDNLPGNGELTRRVVCAFARLSDQGLGDWIEAEVSFPNCMVDRITPATSQQDIDLLATRFGVQDGWPVVSETFEQWVVEDRFTQGRPPLEDAGVQFVEDVSPYELMKLRILNAGHQALCFLGFLEGYRYVHEVCQDPVFYDFVLSFMQREAAPTLPVVPELDVGAYSHLVLDRFANPEISDTLERLCSFTSDRIPKFLLPVVRENLFSGGEVRLSAVVVASWATYAQDHDVVDNRHDDVRAAAAAQADDPLSFLRNREIFGDLIDQTRFTDAYLEALQSLTERPVREALKDLESSRDDSTG